jgi:Flp pilus assembly protein TadG
MTGSKRERGSAVVDFVLVMLVLVPLVLGIVQLGLVLHVRNTLTAAATEGARAAAPVDADPTAGAERTRQEIRESLADRFATDVRGVITTINGVPASEVVVHAEVPALGLFGPSVGLDVTGHAVREVSP